jgi:hypothetical protein
MRTVNPSISSENFNELRTASSSSTTRIVGRGNAILVFCPLIDRVVASSIEEPHEIKKQPKIAMRALT